MSAAKTITTDDCVKNELFAEIFCGFQAER